MSLSALGARAVYIGSGSVGPFSLVDQSANPILFEENSELVVKRYDTDLVETVLTLTTHYSLTGAGSDSAGTLTLATALTSSYLLTIERDTPLTQTLDLQFGGGLSLEDLEERLDKLTRITQELDDRLSRRPALFPYFTGTPYQIAPPEDGGLLTWDTSTRTIISTDASDSALLLSGSGAPSSGLGDDGDFYIDTAASRLYGPKTAGAWGSGVSLIGATGATGPAGPEGPQGEPGAPGSGSGDVVGPSSATDDAIVVFSGTTGKIMRETTITGAQLNTLHTNAYTSGGTNVRLADGGTGADLTDPGADRIMFWDDSATSVAFLAVTTPLSISGTTLSWAHLGLESLTDPGADRIFFWDDSATASGFLTMTNGLEITGTNLQMTQGQREAGIPIVIDGGGTTITTGVKGYVPMPFTGIITQWDLLPDQSGSISIDIWKDTYANFPPTNADSITGSTQPTVTTNTKATDSTLTGWTSTFTKGDILGINVDSATVVQRATLMLYLRKTG